MVDTDDTRRTIHDGRRTTPGVWHKLPTGELKIKAFRLKSQKKLVTELPILHQTSTFVSVGSGVHVSPPPKKLFLKQICFVLTTLIFFWPYYQKQKYLLALKLRLKCFFRLFFGWDVDGPSPFVIA